MSATDVAVVVPWRPGCPHRERAWRWVRARYETEHPEWELVESPSPEGLFNRSAAAMAAIELVDANIVVVADADVWCDRTGDAVAEVSAGKPWAIPHRMVHRLTKVATDAFLTDNELGRKPFDFPPYLGIEAGGIAVVPRTTALEIPLDVRFVGWGGEETAWGSALSTMAGPAARLGGVLVHLWHPPQQRTSRRLGSKETEALRRRYQLAARKPALMPALVSEAVSARWPV